MLLTNTKKYSKITGEKFRNITPPLKKNFLNNETPVSFLLGKSMQLLQEQELDCTICLHSYVLQCVKKLFVILLILKSCCIFPSKNYICKIYVYLSNNLHYVYIVTYKKQSIQYFYELSYLQFMKYQV